MRPLLGISLKVVSALSFTLMSVIIKDMSARYPVGEMMFFRSAFGVVPLIVWLMARGEFPAALATDNVPGHLKRSMFGSFGQFCGFSALGFLSLSESIAIGYASPLFVVILAALVLGETVRRYRWGAVGIGFVGVMIMLLPRLIESGTATGMRAASMFGVAFAIVGACCSAFATIETRRLTETEQTGAIVFYFMGLTSVLSLISLPLGWNMPSQADAALLITAGLLGGVGQILLTQSYRHAEISLVAPFEYTTMIWTLMLGWMVFDELPGTMVAVGAGIVAAAGCFVVWRERQLGIENRRAAEAAASARGA